MFQVEQKSNKSSDKNKHTDTKKSGWNINPAEMLREQSKVMQRNAGLSQYSAEPLQMQEDEEEIQAKETPAQLQEEEELQAKKEPAQMMVEEEEKKVQAKQAPAQMQEEEEEDIQPKMSTAQLQEEEEEQIQPKKGQQKSENSASKSVNSFAHLNMALQTKMQNSFGTSFQDVNIHQNDGSASQKGALAYTQGNNVHFAPGQFNPNTQGGQELLGHELTHVVQQRQGRVQPTKQGKGLSVNDNPTLEKEADDAGKQAANNKNNESIFSSVSSSNPELSESNIQYKLVQKSEKEPPLSRKDKKKYTYGSVTGNLYTEHSTGNVVSSTDTTGKGIDIDDVNQGLLGDCYFLAAIAAIANSNPASLKKLIKDNGDGTVDVTLYPKKNIFSKKRKAHVETVSLDFPLDKHGTPAYARLGKNDELWVMILEKAFAQYKGGYKKISGGYPGKAMELLSGGKSKGYFTRFKKEETIIQIIKDALDNSKAVTASSRGLSEKKEKKSGVYGRHAYTVKSIDESNKTICLHNPWGYDHVIDMSISDFKKYYRKFEILN